MASTDGYFELEFTLPDGKFGTCRLWAKNAEAAGDKVRAKRKWKDAKITGTWYLPMKPVKLPK